MMTSSIDDAVNQTVTLPLLPPTPVIVNNCSYPPDDDVEFYVNGVATNVIVALGLVGNALSIAVMAQKAMRCTTNYYLSALAVWDSVVLVCTALMIGLNALPIMRFYRCHVFAYVIAYVYPVALTAHTATVWLTVSFTVERFVAICFPMSAPRLCTMSNARRVIAAVAVFAVAYNVTRWAEYAVVEGVDASTGKRTKAMIMTPFGRHPVYQLVYFTWLYVPFMCVIPLLLLSIFNAFLVASVHRSRRQQRAMNVKQRRENSVTTTLVLVVIVFIICQFPALVYNIAFSLDYAHVTKSPGYTMLSHVRNFLVTLNSAINFLLYCASGQKFRTTLRHTVCRSQAPPRGGANKTGAGLSYCTSDRLTSIQASSFVNRISIARGDININVVRPSTSQPPQRALSIDCDEPLVDFG